METINAQKSNVKIVEGIIKLAKSLELSIVAEGMEYPEQDMILKQLGCDIAQGFLHAKPMPLDKLLTFIEQRQEQAQGKK